jgi:hypothetical protein
MASIYRVMASKYFPISFIFNAHIKDRHYLMEGLFGDMHFFKNRTDSFTRQPSESHKEFFY